MHGLRVRFFVEGQFPSSLFIDDGGGKACRTTQYVISNSLHLQLQRVFTLMIQKGTHSSCFKMSKVILNHELLCKSSVKETSNTVAVPNVSSVPVLFKTLP